MNNMLSKAIETGILTDFPNLIDPRKAHLYQGKPISYCYRVTRRNQSSLRAIIPWQIYGFRNTEWRYFVFSPKQFLEMKLQLIGL